jgi:hypothetical protein
MTEQNDTPNKNSSYTGWNKPDNQSSRQDNSNPNKSDNFKLTNNNFNRESVSLNESGNALDNSKYDKEEYDHTGFNNKNQDSRSYGFRTDNTGFNKGNKSEEYSESPMKRNVSQYESNNSSPKKNKQLVKNRNNISNTDLNNTNVNDIIKRDLQEYLSNLEQQNLLKIKPKDNNKWELEFNENEFISKEQWYRNKTEREWNTAKEGAKE